MVAFGGDGVLDQPRSVVGNEGVFVSHYNGLLPLFDYITPGNGSSDIYAAIVYAMGLVFRPGVSKNFILLPCSDCKESNMKVSEIYRKSNFVATRNRETNDSFLIPSGESKSGASL